MAQGPYVLDRVLAYDDEELAEPTDGLDERIVELFERAAAVGRDEINGTVFGASPSDVDMWASIDVHRCVFWLPRRSRTR